MIKIVSKTMSMVPKHIYVPMALEVIEVRENTGKSIRQIIRNMVGMSATTEKRILALENNVPGYKESWFTKLKKIRALYLYFQTE